MIIYKAENIITNEIYIGITKKRLCERKRDHVYEAFKRNLKDKFHSALRQFGLLSFNWTVLFETNSYKMLASKEIEYIDKYNALEDPQTDMEKEYKNWLYLKILYNIPAGFQLTARMSTNYRCLLNIYNQRHNHRLPEWRDFCEQLLEELPYFKEFVEVYMNNSTSEKEE